MGIFDGFLLLTDLDGTLTLKGGRNISSENTRAIRRYQKNGGLFSVATGRSPEFIKNFDGMIEINAPIVSVNGTLICSPDGKTKLREYLMNDEILPVIQFLVQNERVQNIYTGNANGQYNCKSDGSVKERTAYYESVSRPWYKIVSQQSVEYTPELLNELRRRFGTAFEYDRSYPMGVEIHKKGSGKGACMDWIVKHSGLPIKETIAVGDYENDISMIERATYGYAVENAIDEVKAKAKYITVSSDESAIARIIDDIEAICLRRNS